MSGRDRDVEGDDFFMEFADLEGEGHHAVRDGPAPVSLSKQPRELFIRGDGLAASLPYHCHPSESFVDQ